MNALQTEQVVYHVFGFLDMTIAQKAILCQVKQWQQFFTKSKFLNLVYCLFNISGRSFYEMDQDLDPKILSRLSNVTYLANLQIPYNSSTADYLNPISLLTNLTKLVYFTNIDITNDNLSTLIKLRSLTLTSSMGHMYSINGDVLSNLTNITCLEFSGHNLLDVKCIAFHTQLINLKLSYGTKITNMQSLTNLENLTHFSCSGYECITQFDLQFLPYLTNLQSLTLDNCKNIQHYESLGIEKLTNLKCLQLSNTKKLLHVNFLSHLHLTNLDLSRCKNLDNIDVYRMRSLVDINISNCPKLKIIPLMVNITSVNLAHSNRIVDSSLASLLNSPKLTCLHLQGCNLLIGSGLQYVCSTLQTLTLRSENNLFSLDYLPKGLQRLDIYTPEFFNVSKHLSILELTQLTYIKISSTNFDPRFNLQTLVNLIHLDIECSSVTDDVFDGIENLLQLRYLTLDSDLITNKGINKITNPNLEKLVFYGDIDMSGCNFDLLQNLKEMSIINGINMTDTELMSIAKLSLLKELSIPDTDSVTEQGLSHLSNLKNLKSLVYGNASEPEDSLFFPQTEIYKYLTTLFSSNVHISKYY
jgi:hypothetical protein